MDNQNDSGNSRYWIVALILGLLLLLLPWLFNIGPNSWKSCAAPVATAAVQQVPVVPADPTLTPAPESEPVPEPAAEPAPVAEEVQQPAPPVARVYFDVDSFAVPQDAETVLKETLDYLKANSGSSVKLIGFHDSQGGSLAYNKRLADNRARNVQVILMGEGISNRRITIDRPQETTGTGSDNEARRVEVSIVP
jgi:K(+)-stimulated pyrophosphate-energized sodium pump